MKDEVAGDPCSGLKWTFKATKKIARALRDSAIEVSARTVARILKKLEFSLRVNRRMIGRGSAGNRDQQFRYIGRVRADFVKRRQPIVSIDSKKRELVGNFKNGGVAWRRAAFAVNVYDFRSDAKGIALSNGIYDLQANVGTIYVGTSHDTPDFAVDNIVRWWSSEGRKRYPKGQHLLVLADGGGSNGCRSRSFKYGLQTRFCNVYGITITVCHYPPGASKWNPIEHRLFSEISKNWKGRPLDSYETILNYIRTTRTNTGLRVRACLIRKGYPTGVKISEAQMSTIDIRRHRVQPSLNYTIGPTI
jgi:hypothetical protein